MTRRIAVSLPEHLVAEAAAAADSGRASSVSAYVAEALAEKSGRHSLDDFLRFGRAVVTTDQADIARFAPDARLIPV